MIILPNEGLEFKIKHGRAARFEKTTQKYTDKTAINLFEIALWYAQRDGEGDHRLDASWEEKAYAPEIRKEIISRSMAGIAIPASELPSFSLETKLYFAHGDERLVVVTSELGILGDMVELLPIRVQQIHESNKPKYDRLLQSANGHVLGTLRTAETNNNWQQTA